ncbi:hypothetical protein RhiirA4_469089 [Rhizophagus irregularis]|uniref:Uncharacterized protein n=1 Tax=Rhizophagus irregularis TaxID=588596 RepID=A0A2I1GYX0_9GLOM|nr:hypothetical protein RhiirA4_469089 [Rhizophagus irregularis]
MIPEQPQAHQNTPNITENENYMEDITATTSNHALSHSENDISSRDPKEKDLQTQTPITPHVEESTFMDEDPIETNPNKGKSIDQQTNTQNNSIKIMELNDLFESTTQNSNKVYKGFIPRDSFQLDLTNNDIINLLKSAFINDTNAFRFECNSLSTYRYFTIIFRTRDSLDQYIRDSPPSLKNVKIYELTNNAINTLIEQKFNNLDNAVIKILDIPYQYDIKMLLKHLANKTKSAILDHKEIKKPPRKLPNRNRQGKPIFINLTYKQLLVRFQKQSAFDYFMQGDHWNLEIENFLIRILPGNPENPEYIKRTKSYYKITGLPLNTTARDIEPIIKHLYGRTCTFTQTSKYSTMKNAYIYVDPANYPDNITNAVHTPFNGYKIYIYPHTITTKTCNICGITSHPTDKCDDKNFILDKNNRKIFTKRIIKRNNEKITINDDYKSKYSHIISLNANKIRSNELNMGTNNQYRQQRTQNPSSTTSTQRSYRYDQQYIPPTLQQDQLPNYKAMEDKIRQLENQVINLTNKITQLENTPKHIDSKFSNIEKQFTTIETNLNTINARQDKYDIIIQKLTDNISKISDKIYNDEKPTKTSKRSSPYIRTNQKEIPFTF